MTFIAALRADRIDAPFVFDGPINGTLFRAWLEQSLVPTLRPGDVVIMDNLGSHKSKAITRAKPFAPHCDAPEPTCRSCHPTRRT